MDAVPGDGGSAGAALMLIGASGLMNYAFMTSLGKSAAEQQILGAVSIAVSAFLALLPTLLLWATRERRMVYVMLGVPVFLAFAVFSLSSAVGFAAKSRGSLSEERALATARLASVTHEIEDTETKLARSSKVSRSTAESRAKTTNQDRLTIRQQAEPKMPSKALIASRLPVRRGLDENEAAIYLSFSPSFFRKLVAEKRTPRPRLAEGRRIWDVEELDLAFKALPREGGEAEPIFIAGDREEGGNPWDDVLR